jgi:hypothetical protein
LLDGSALTGFFIIIPNEGVVISVTLCGFHFTSSGLSSNCLCHKFLRWRGNMRRLLVAGCAVLAMAGCVTPLQDSSNAQPCKQHGFQENTEDFTICRKWRNAETVAADPDNFGLFVTKGFSQFACEDHHKLTAGTEEHDKCIDKYKSIGAEKNKYIQSQQD